MSLGDLVRESDIFDLLHVEDSKIIVRARNNLKEAPVQSFMSGDHIDRSWFDNNIKCQEELLQLKTRVDNVYNVLKLKLKAQEGEGIDNGQFSYIKTIDERLNVMLYLDSSFKDKKESLDNLKIISTYVDGLIWSLRDLMKLFKK